MTGHPSTLTCRLCNDKAELKFNGHIGYQSNKSYDIFHCPNCEVAFAHPMNVDHDLYDLIYKNSEKIPGYERYQRFRKEVLSQDSPLNYLSEQEDVYWGIKKYLDSHNSSSYSKIKILEVGCGLGYLTYALRKAGLQATGIDISQIAIKQAKECYGDFYLCEDVQKYSDRVGKTYDIIILTEVIEHIPNIKEFITALDNLLKPTGELVLTTPNRSSYPKNLLWETEPPSVHLWWFSEPSIINLAKQFGYQARFIDFSDCSHEPLRIIIDENHPFIPTRQPRLDSLGDVINDQHNLSAPRTWKTIVKNILNSFYLLELLQNISLLRKPIKVKEVEILIDSKRRHTLCAILKKN